MFQYTQIPGGMEEFVVIASIEQTNRTIFNNSDKGLAITLTLLVLRNNVIGERVNIVLSLRKVFWLGEPVFRNRESSYKT